jgi:hypothetical protein
MLHFSAESLAGQITVISVVNDNHKDPYRCKIWGFHGGDYEEWCLLGCYAVWLL